MLLSWCRQKPLSWGVCTAFASRQFHCSTRLPSRSHRWQPPEEDHGHFRKRDYQAEFAREERQSLHKGKKDRLRRMDKRVSKHAIFEDELSEYQQENKKTKQFLGAATYEDWFQRKSELEDLKAYNDELYYLNKNRKPVTLFNQILADIKATRKNGVLSYQDVFNAKLNYLTVMNKPRSATLPSELEPLYSEAMALAKPTSEVIPGSEPTSYDEFMKKYDPSYGRDEPTDMNAQSEGKSSSDIHFDQQLERLKAMTLDRKSNRKQKKTSEDAQSSPQEHQEPTDHAAIKLQLQQIQLQQSNPHQPFFHMPDETDISRTARAIDKQAYQPEIHSNLETLNQEYNPEVDKQSYGFSANKKKKTYKF